MCLLYCKTVNTRRVGITHQQLHGTGLLTDKDAAHPSMIQKTDGQNTQLYAVPPGRWWRSR